jgi:RNA polymerase sigma factor (sigma-70 family)
MSLEPRELEALVARDERAWRHVMARHGKLAMLAARRLRLGPEDQDEVYQEAWINAYRAIGSLKDPTRFGSWFYRIAYRRALDMITRKRPEAPAPELPEDGGIDDLPADHPAVDEVMIRDEDARRIRSAVEALDERCRVLLTALFLVDPRPSYEDICAECGIPIGSIGPTRARCLKKLAKLLDEVSPAADGPSVRMKSPPGASGVEQEVPKERETS